MCDLSVVRPEEEKCLSLSKEARKSQASSPDLIKGAATKQPPQCCCGVPDSFLWYDKNLRQSQELLTIDSTRAKSFLVCYVHSWKVLTESCTLRQLTSKLCFLHTSWWRLAEVRSCIGRLKHCEHPVGCEPGSHRAFSQGCSCSEAVRRLFRHRASSRQHMLYWRPLGLRQCRFLLCEFKQLTLQ